MDGVRMTELLVFSADWCGPCKNMERAGVYREVEAAGFKVTKINVDTDRAKANLYRISAMPTFVVLKNGSEQSRSIGARSAAQLLSELEG